MWYGRNSRVCVQRYQESSEAFTWSSVKENSESRSPQFCFPKGSYHCSLRHSCEAKGGRGMQGKYSLYWDPICSKWEGQGSHYATLSSKQLSARPGKVRYSAICKIKDAAAAGAGDSVTKESFSLGSLASGKKDEMVFDWICFEA